MGTLAEQMRKDHERERKYLSAELRRLYTEQTHIWTFICILSAFGVVNILEVEEPFNRMLAVLTTAGVIINAILLLDVRQQLSEVRRQTKETNESIDRWSRA